MISKTVQRLRSAISCDSFTFIINGTEVESDLLEAVRLSPAVHEQLLADKSTRNFVICDSEIDPRHFSCLQQLISGESISIHRSFRKSLLLLCRQLYNMELEEFFFGLWFDDCSSSLSETITMNLVDVLTRTARSVSASNFYLHSNEDISLLTIDALEDLLSSDSLRIESEDALLRQLLELGSGYLSLVRHIRFEFLSSKGIEFFVAHFRYFDLTESIWEGICVRLKGICDSSIQSKRFVYSSRTSSVSIASSVPRLDSQILSDFPSIFSEFCYKTFDLLYRGSRDGFSSEDFHKRCDGHRNTLTVILDTNGSVFGGFTPLAWDSVSQFKCDKNLTTFLFTLKNPHNITARKFMLKADQKSRAIYCSPGHGPVFGNYFYLYSTFDSASSPNLTGHFGNEYTNDTGLSDDTVFTGSGKFRAQEVEVFELRD
jgi:hypothetical protein